MRGEKSESGKVAPLRKAVPCPMCKKPSQRASYPFCSARCKDLDLNRWFNGQYTIPVVETDPASDEIDIQDHD